MDVCEDHPVEKPDEEELLYRFISQIYICMIIMQLLTLDIAIPDN